MDRFGERILGYKDQLAARQYINSNLEEVTKQMNKMIEDSQLLWTGQINGDKSTKNYNLYGNTILVMDTANSILITLYDIDFGFGKELDQIIAAKLLEEVNALKVELAETKAKVEESAETKKIELENVKSDLASLREQVTLLEFKRQSRESEIKTIYNDVEIVSKKIQAKALKLCNSLEYKRELEKIAK